MKCRKLVSILGVCFLTTACHFSVDEVQEFADLFQYWYSDDHSLEFYRAGYDFYTGFIFKEGIYQHGYIRDSNPLIFGECHIFFENRDSRNDYISFNVKESNNRRDLYVNFEKDINGYSGEIKLNIRNLTLDELDFRYIYDSSTTNKELNISLHRQGLFSNVYYLTYYSNHCKVKLDDETQSFTLLDTDDNEINRGIYFTHFKYVDLNFEDYFFDTQFKTLRFDFNTKGRDFS